MLAVLGCGNVAADILILIWYSPYTKKYTGIIAIFKSKLINLYSIKKVNLFIRVSHLLRVIETEEDPIWYKPYSRHITPGRKNYLYYNEHTKRVFILFFFLIFLPYPMCGHEGTIFPTRKRRDSMYIKRSEGKERHDGLFFFTDTKNKKLKNQWEKLFLLLLLLFFLWDPKWKSISHTSENSMSVKLLSTTIPSTTEHTKKIESLLCFSPFL